MTVWHLGTSWIFGLKGWTNCIVYLRHHICSAARLRTVGLQPIGVKLEEWWDESCVCPPCFCHASCVFATTCLSCLRFFGSQIAHLNLVALNWVPRSANLVATSPQGCLSLSLYSKGGLDIGFGSWQDVDAKKAALLVKSYLSITRGWTKDCVRECKLGRSTNPNRYTPMSSSWCWWVCFLFHACELFSYLGWFGHLFVYLIFIIPIMIIFGFGCFEICHLFLTSCQGHYVISQVAWTLYPICWLTVLASWHRSLQCNPQIKHVEVPKKTG